MPLASSAASAGPAPDRRALRSELTVSWVSSAAPMPLLMPALTDTVRYCRDSDQSKLSPETVYAGSSWPARENSSPAQVRPGSSSHCSSAAMVSRLRRRTSR